MLPETQPGTMTSLVNRYVAAATHLAFHQVGGRVEGQLTDNDGRPLAGATVAVAAIRTGETGEPAIHSWSGNVPKMP